MQVDVEHRLAGISLAVEHETCAALFEAEVFRDKLCAVEHLAHEFAIFRLHVHDGCDVALRHDQKVYRSLRGDVIEGEHIVVFVDFLGRDFTLDDFAEKTIFTHSVIIVVKVLVVCVVDIQLGDCFLIQYRLLNQLHVDEQGDDCEDIEEYFEDKDVPYNREEKTCED